MKIRPITDLRKTQEISNDIHSSNEPIIITKNGYGDMIIYPYSENNDDKNEKINNYNNVVVQDNDENMGYLNVATVPLELKVADPTFNALQIIDKVKEYSNKGSKIIVFPELSLSSYTSGDLFLNRTLKDVCIKEINHILQETKNCNSLFVFGSPIEFNDKLYNTAIVVFKGEILGIVPKKYIPNYSEFYEARYFAKGSSDINYINLFGKKIPFSTNLLFQNALNSKEIIGIEICEDLWVNNSPSFDHVNAGATIILNLSASNEVIGKEEYRKNLVSFTSSKLICAYLYCSATNDESTTDLLFSGSNMICENGKFLAYTSPFENKACEATIDLDYLNNERLKMTSLDNQNRSTHLYIYYKNEIKLDKILRNYSQNPFIPNMEEEKVKRYKKIIKMQALGLTKRMKHTNTKKLVLGLSGGLDSTLAYLVCIEALDILNLEHKNLIAITLPCFGTSKRTKDNATDLANIYNSTLLEINIKESVTKHLEDINHPLNNHDVTYENAQARERTQVLMDYANKVGGLVIGTGDLSEIALGWSTYNGDHMSMYAVNGSIPKTLIRDMINVLAKGTKAEKVLLDILNTPVSPELLPADKNGNITQLTEDIVGPYQLHDFFLFMFIRYQFSLKKIYFISKLTFKDIYDDETLKKWLKNFVKRFFSQQFKRSCMPDGVKIGSICLSPRGDWRMPSDASSAIYLKEIENI